MRADTKDIIESVYRWSLGALLALTTWGAIQLIANVTKLTEMVYDLNTRVTVLEYQNGR